MKATVLPENMLRCMSAKDRQELGQKTASEILEAGEAKSERELQKQIVGLLRLKGIEVNVSRTDKRKTDRVGWPDITFAVSQIKSTGSMLTHACLWEIKMPRGQLSAEQICCADRLINRPNAWRYRIIRSVYDALRELREMGVE